MAEPDTGRDSLYYVGEVSALSSSGEQAPTLMWHNSQGNLSLHPHSGNLSVGIVKQATRPNRWFDYDFGVELTGRVSGTQRNVTAPEIAGTGYFRELYAHARLYIVDITAGIHPMTFGAGDPELRAGGLLFSGNAHPFPRISIGIDRWTAFPGLYGYLEVKGGLTHGWLGDQSAQVRGTLLHHKYIGGRIGGKLPVNISYEFHHAAQWGGYSNVYGDLGNNWQAFKKVFMVQSGGSMDNDQINAQGNHIGFQQLAVEVKGEGWHIEAYWQAMNEDGPIRFIGFGMNNKDGLWGLSFHQSHWPFISACSLEFFNTTDQSGPFHDLDGLVFGGADTYYENSIYTQGWSYYGRIMGLPFLAIGNSRVMGGQAGVKGDIFGFRYRAICSHSRNFGNYSAPKQSHNTAVLVEVKKYVEKAWGLEFGLALSGDFGTQFGNSFGAMVTVVKKGIICTW